VEQGNIIRAQEPLFSGSIFTSSIQCLIIMSWEDMYHTCTYIRKAGMYS